MLGEMQNCGIMSLESLQGRTEKNEQQIEKRNNPGSPIKWRPHRQLSVRLVFLFAEEVL